MDDKSDFVWSYFLKKKNAQVDVLVKLIKTLKSKHFNVKYIRCDNAGENKSFEVACQDLGWDITFEYTPPHSPQYNGRVERKIATLFLRLRATLNGAGLPPSYRQRLWAECANFVTRLENVTAHIRYGECFVPHKLMWGRTLKDWSTCVFLGRLES